jgi:thermitase
LAISLGLAAVLAVAALGHGVVFDGAIALASGSSVVHQSGPGEHDQPVVDGASSQAVYSGEDTGLSERWGVLRIGAPEAWEITAAGRAVIVAVLDTGISRSNGDLAQRVVAEINLTASPTSDDVYGHGTHMAGTIVAVAPECLLMNVKVADDRGRCDPAVVARGIVWAADQGANVINISLAMEGSPELEEAVDYAWNRGAIVLAAAGNRGRSDPAYPAYYANTVAVAGTNRNDALALLSSYGYWVDVAAPGLNIYSDLPGDQYGYKTGTSAAVAHVSGVAALVFSVAEDLNGSGAINDEVRRAIEGSCTALSGEGLGRGLVNAYQAVTMALSGA